MNQNSIDLTLAAPSLQSDEKSQAVLQDILAAMNCRAGTIHRFDSDSKQLMLAAQVAIPAELFDKVNAIPIGKGVAGVAAEKREAIQLFNLQTDACSVANPDAKKTQVAGSLVVPIVNSDDQLVGTLGVGMFEPHEFNDDETGKLWDISRWIAPSLN